jgi:hypothetical protein
MISRSRLLNVFVPLYERCNGDAFQYIVSWSPTLSHVCNHYCRHSVAYLHLYPWELTYSISSFEVETRQPSTYRADVIMIKLLSDKATLSKSLNSQYRTVLLRKHKWLQCLLKWSFPGVLYPNRSDTYPSINNCLRRKQNNQTTS